MTGTMRDMSIDWDQADRRAIGRAVQAARLAQGLGKEEACRRAGISPITWARIEDGVRVQDAKLAAACSALGIGFTLPGTQPGEIVRVGQPRDDDAPTLEERVAELERQLRRITGEAHVTSENPETPSASA